MTEDLLVDPEALREQVRIKYREVAAEPHRTFHFHTGRPLAARLGYDPAAVDALPDGAVESFAGVGNPFTLRRLKPGERVVDVVKLNAPAIRKSIMVRRHLSHLPQLMDWLLVVKVFQQTRKLFKAVSC